MPLTGVSGVQSEHGPRAFRVRAVLNVFGSEDSVFVLFVFRAFHLVVVSHLRLTFLYSGPSLLFSRCGFDCGYRPARTLPHFSVRPAARSPVYPSFLSSALLWPYLSWGFVACPAMPDFGPYGPKDTKPDLKDSSFKLFTSALVFRKRCDLFAAKSGNPKKGSRFVKLGDSAYEKPPGPTSPSPIIGRCFSALIITGTSLI